MASSTDPGVEIVEVGPRDGLQNEATPTSTAHKLELIRRLGSNGLRTIEATSFVRPDAVPQLADADAVMDGLDLDGGIDYPVLVPNLRGYQRAREHGARSIAVLAAASESFSHANVNASIAQSLTRIAQVAAAAQADGVAVRGYVSTAFGCPFEGPVDPGAVERVTTALLELGIDDVSIGDTIGVAVPADIPAVSAPLLRLGIRRLALHLHDTRGTALANAIAGMELGIRVFDSSIGGLGGCPFAPGATGNLATEDLVWLLERSGVSTGLDLDGLIDTAQWVNDLLKHEGSGHIARVRVWPDQFVAHAQVT